MFKMYDLEPADKLQDHLRTKYHWEVAGIEKAQNINFKQT